MYLVFDTETGGLSTDCSLLTAYFVVLNEKLEVQETLSLVLRPENGAYIVDASALDVNKINLIEHDKVAVPYTRGAQLLLDLLARYTLDGNKLTPIGWNIISFDLPFIHAYLVDKKTWERYCSYHIVDLCSSAKFLQIAGVLPKGRLRLKDVADFFGLDTSMLHTAKQDTVLTIEVGRKLVELVRGGNARVSK